jgi:hypothetical protein
MEHVLNLMISTTEARSESLLEQYPILEALRGTYAQVNRKNLMRMQNRKLIGM